MIAVIIIICSILIAIIRGGRISILKDVKFICPYLVVISLIIEVLAQLCHALPSWIPPTAFVLQYLLLLTFIALNIKQRYMKVIGLGIFLNFLVILFNGGAMPVSQHILEIPSLAKLADMLVSGKFSNYTLMSYQTPLWFLGDIIYIPILGGQFISIGDIILIIGIFFYIQYIVLSKKNK